MCFLNQSDAPRWLRKHIYRHYAPIRESLHLLLPMSFRDSNLKVKGAPFDKEVTMADKLPTADEAYELTHKQILNASGGVLDRIVDAINEAASNLKAEASITLRDRERFTAQHVLELLIATGYKATSTEYEEHGEGILTCLSFSWGKEKKK